MQVSVTEGPVGAWPSKLFIDVSRREAYRWIGIGVPRKSVRTRKSDNKIVEVPIAYPGVELLCSGDSCRRFILKHLIPNLKDTDEYNAFTAADWDQVIPRDIEFVIQDQASDILIDCACRCDVSIELTIQFVYCETTALLQGFLNSKCECSICNEELDPTGDDVLYLPECIHRFHIYCIIKWFKRSATCPVCRHNYSHFISDSLCLGLPIKKMCSKADRLITHW